MRRLIDNIEAIPDVPVVTFVDGEGQDVATVDFGSLGLVARQIAGRLRGEAGVERGDRALMLYTPSLEFVHALAGCLVAGVVPVPVCPPDPFNLRREMGRLRAIVQDCDPAVALCNAEYAQVRGLGDLGTGGDGDATAWPELRWLQTDDAATDAPFDPVAIRDDELAVLQYTSGSTGDPKGVAITHANVEHQSELNRRRLGLTPESRAVFWVPHYHDFGLISGIMNAFSGHGHIRLLSPLSFVARPSVWFDVLSRVHGTHTASPNFGYELIIARSTPEQRAGWDLSSLRVAMSAAEPINPATVQRLREVFAPCGFRPDAFCPSYGLAEHTVGVTMAGVAEIAFDELRLEDEGIAESAESGLAPGRRARTIVGCGRPVEVDVRIVDPDTCAELPAGRVGEIWVDSPSKAAGYWGRPEESVATFRASLSDGDGHAHYLRTGDMGFLYDGELFVTGRRSEMLIVRGRNIFPQDLEATVIAAHERIRPGGAVAFALKTRSDVSDDDVEGVGLVVEVRKSDEAPAPELLDEIGRAVERAVNEFHGVNPARVTVCRPGAVAKTSSGKRKRAATRDALLAGELDRDGLVLADRGGEVEAPAEPAAEVEPEYERLIADTARQFALMAGASPRRLFHPRATTLRGRLRVLALVSPDLDATAIFSAGAEHPVIVRHANGVTDDDAAWDNRGATVRVLPAGRPEDLDAPVLDLLLTTGACFTSATAADFVAWMAAGRAQREDLVRRSPHLGTAAWEMFRLPDAYNHVHYHSKVASRYRTVDGRELLVRYRLIDPERPEDGGLLEPDGLLPPDRAERLSGETRSATFLHERLRGDMAAGGLRYLLQVQLRPHHEAALDATRAWEEPWLDRAELLLTEIVDDARIEPLTFNPANAPEPLGLVPATRSTEPASLNHLRSIVYAAAAERRMGAPAPKRVAVIGGGVSGLTAARELERRGHKVVVLERCGEVGGKARSIEVDGLPFDLGAHLCSRGYERLGVLLRELGIGTEDVTEVILWNLEAGGARSLQDPAVREDFMRYQQLKHERFPDVTVPGLARGGAELDRPAHDFFAEHDLQALGRIISLGYTASGYGFLADDAVSAYRVLKYAEVATLCMPGDQLSFWTPKGGFGNIWRKVADGLADVRLNCRVEAIRPHEDRVLVETGDGRLEVDAVVLACQPHELGDALQRDSAPADARHIPYATVVARASGLPRDGFFLVDDHLEDPSTAGHVVAFHHRYPEADVYLFWAYIDADADDEALLAPLRDDVARMGGTLDEVVSIHRWDYAPHLPLPAAAAHAEVEASQGREGIFWVGSLHNFELVETNMRYALYVAELVDRRLTGSAAAAPETTAPVLATTNGDRVGSLVDYLVGELSRVLRRPAESFTPEHHLLDLGLDSVRAVEIFEAIGRDTGIELAPLAMYEHSTIQALAAHLAELSAETVAGPAAPIVARGLDPRRAVHDQLMDAEGEATRAALLLDLIITVSAEHLGVTRESIDVQATMTEFGLDSVKSVESFEAVLARSGLSLPPAVLAEHRTFAGLAQRLAVEFARAYPAARTAAAPPALALRGLDPGRTVFDQLMEAEGTAARAALLLDLIVTATAKRIAVARESIDVQAGMAEFGLDSVTSVEVFEAVLERSGLSLPPAVLAEHPTFAALAQRLAVEFARAHPTARTAAGTPAGADLAVLTTRVGRIEGVLEDIQAQLAVLAGGAVTNGDGPAPAAVVQDDPSQWVRRHRRTGRPADLSLVCFHSAGLDAPMYDPWVDAMPDGVELCAVRLPGRGAHSGTPVATMDELLPMLRTALEPWLDRRFAFFGHSFGALTAYAMTRYLRDRGERLPVRLIVAGFWAPDRWVCRPELTAMMEGKVAPGLTLDQRIMDSWAYQPGAPLPLPISVFAGAHDLLVKRDDVDGWSEQSATSTDLHIVPGGHFQLVTDPLVIRTVSSLISIDLSAGAPPRPAAAPPAPPVLGHWLWVV
jgi:acyl-CoA synthetase (AMP-forming)/AMP-acid ligase II/surfactin synthase thioesterase subunit/aryl carrier-like protein